MDLLNNAKLDLGLLINFEFANSCVLNNLIMKTGLKTFKQKI